MAEVLSMHRLLLPQAPDLTCSKWLLAAQTVASGGTIVDVLPMHRLLLSCLELLT